MESTPVNTTSFKLVELTLANRFLYIFPALVDRIDRNVQPRKPTAFQILEALIGRDGINTVWSTTIHS